MIHGSSSPRRWRRAPRRRRGSDEGRFRQIGQEFGTTLCVEFPNGQQIDFETPEALERALGTMRGGTPLVVRDERTARNRCCGRPASMIECRREPAEIGTTTSVNS